MINTRFSPFNTLTLSPILPAFQGNLNGINITKTPLDIHPEEIKPWIFTADHQPVLPKLTSVTAGDANEVEQWFNESTNPNQPAYQDEKYHQWWLNLIKQDGQAEVGTKTLALRKDGKILGMLFIEERQLDQYDGQMTTLLRGMRVAPEVNTTLNKNAPYKGVGKALLIQALAESARLQTSGIGLTSSHGVEDYYSSIFGRPVMSRQHPDDPADIFRQYYILKGDARNQKLRYLQAQSHRLQSQWEAQQKPTKNTDIVLAFKGYLGIA